MESTLVIEQLRAHPVLRHCPSHSLARLLPHIEERTPFEPRAFGIGTLLTSFSVEEHVHGLKVLFFAFLFFFTVTAGTAFALQCTPVEGVGSALQFDEEAGRWAPESLLALERLESSAGIFLVGTKQTPSFALKSASGSWEGISIDLWKEIWPGLSQEPGLEGEACRILEFRDITSLRQALAEKRIEAAVAALTITGEREEQIDFSTPFFFTGLGIAVLPSDSPQWASVFKNIFDAAFLKILIVLVLVSVVVTWLFWLLEKGTDNEHFSGWPNSFLWAITVLSERKANPGDFNRYLSRLLSIALTLVLVTIFAGYTALITSTLTQQSLGEIRDEHDLISNNTPGAVPGTVAAQYLEVMGCDYEECRPDGEKSSLRKGLELLQKGKIKALVHDAPILQYEIRQFARERRDAPRPRLLPTIFKPQYYAVGLPQGSPYREEINRQLLATVEDKSGRWSEIVRRYLGDYSLNSGKMKE